MGKEGAPAVLMTFMSLYPFGVGLALGNSYGNRHADAGARVERVQAYNDQLTHELELGGRVIAHMRVDDAAQGFRFQTVNLAGQKEECDGQYRLRNDVATATGHLACTVMTPVR